MSMPSLPWPTADALPIEPLRPVLDRMTALSMAHPEDITAVPGLAQVDGRVLADPPPCLEQIVDEFGGIVVRGGSALMLLTSERGTEGPYTMLGDAVTYYPLHEDPETESAVVLTLDEHGAPGAVYGIGDDLALRLASPDLAGYLHAYADALEATISELDAAVRTEVAGAEVTDADRDRAARALMRHHLFDALTGADITADLAADGRVASADAPDVAAAGLASPGADAPGTASPDAAAPATPQDDPGEARPLPLDALPRDLAASLPSGTAAVWDLRTASLGIAVPVIDTELEEDADPLELAVFWREGGLVVGLAPRR